MAVRERRASRGWTFLLGGAAVGVAGLAAWEYLRSRKAPSPGSQASRIVLASVNGVTVAGPTISDVPPVHPSYGGTVSALCVLQNTGQLPGNFSLWGILVLSGAGSSGAVQAHLGVSSSNPTTPATGTLNGGASVTQGIYTGPLVYGDQIANYNPSTGLDLWIFVQDTSTNVTQSYLIPSAVFLPMETPSQIVLQNVTLSAT
jgi:hypothetical protein